MQEPVPVLVSVHLLGSLILLQSEDNMIISRLEEVKTKVKVYLDEEYAFTLSEKDIGEYQLREGLEISSELYDNLLWKVLFPRAKEKVVAALRVKDRCEQELRRKLKEQGFPPEVIQETVNYVSYYGYLNDERYATAYIKGRMNKKSKQMLLMELQQKGVEQDLIQIVLHQVYAEAEQEEAHEDPELTAIRKAINKKTKNPEELTASEKQKLMASLYRKGFELSKIRKLLPE